jgi:hypothetical protein
MAKVHSRLRTISMPGPKSNFLNAIGWPAVRERVAAANRVRQLRDEPAEFGDPTALENASLNVLGHLRESDQLRAVERLAINRAFALHADQSIGAVSFMAGFTSRINWSFVFSQQ